MRTLLWLLVLISASIEASEGNCSSLENLQWLQGTWIEEKENKISIESWQIVSSSTIEGFAKVLNDGKKSHYEETRLVEMYDEVFYIAKVAHNSIPVSFKLIRCKDNQFYFENQDHDFPNRIDYVRLDVNSMRVDVSAKSGKGFSVNYLRTP